MPNTAQRSGSSDIRKHRGPVGVGVSETDHGLGSGPAAVASLWGAKTRPDPSDLRIRLPQFVLVLRQVSSDAATVLEPRELASQHMYGRLKKIFVDAAETRACTPRPRPDRHLPCRHSTALRKTLVNLT